MKTLVVAAYAPELAAGRERWEARAIGIGLVESAAGAERALSEVRPDRVLLVGTAGALPGSGLAVGALIVARGASLILRPEEYAPVPMPLACKADPALAAELATAFSAPLVDVVCGVGITSSDDEAARLARAAQVEHLECFSLLRAAERLRIPAAALLIIANGVGAQAAAEWRANHLACEATLRTALERLF
jgi:futalosine hydrolase